MHYYQHHIGDFLRATSQLPPHMMVGYLRLMWRYYETEQPLPDDCEILALKAGVSVDEVRLLLRAYFVLEEGVWKNSRCDLEIAEYQLLCEKNRNNGKRGGRPKKNPQETQTKPSGLPVGTQTEPTRNPDVTLTNNHITNKTPLPPKGERFDEFWTTWPSSSRKVAKATCQTKWAKLRLDDAADRIIAHVRVMKQTESWKTGYEPAPLTYLNQRRWEDDLPAVESGRPEWMRGML